VLTEQPNGQFGQDTCRNDQQNERETKPNNTGRACLASRSGVGDVSIVLGLDVTSLRILFSTVRVCELWPHLQELKGPKALSNHVISSSESSHVPQSSSIVSCNYAILIFKHYFSFLQKKKIPSSYITCNNVHTTSVDNAASVLVLLIAIIFNTLKICICIYVIDLVEE